MNFICPAAERDDGADEDCSIFEIAASANVARRFYIPCRSLSTVALVTISL